MDSLRQQEDCGVTSEQGGPVWRGTRGALEWGVGKDNHGAVRGQGRERGCAVRWWRVCMCVCVCVCVCLCEGGILQGFLISLPARPVKNREGETKSTEPHHHFTVAFSGERWSLQGAESLLLRHRRSLT